MEPEQLDAVRASRGDHFAGIRLAELRLGEGLSLGRDAERDFDQGETRSLATKAACVTGIFSAKNCSTASA